MKRALNDPRESEKEREREKGDRLGSSGTKSELDDNVLQVCASNVGSPQVGVLQVTAHQVTVLYFVQITMSSTFNPSHNPSQSGCNETP